MRLADIEMSRAAGHADLPSRSTTCWRSPTSPAIRRWRSPSRSRRGGCCSRAPTPDAAPPRRVPCSPSCHAGRERAGGVGAGGRPSDGGRARRAGVERARRRRDRRAGRGGARAALPSRAPLRGGRALRGGAGGADAAPLGGRSARARLELRAGAAVGRGDPRGRDPVRGDARVGRRARRRGVRPFRARRGAGARRRSAAAPPPTSGARSRRWARGPTAVDAALALVRIAASDTAAGPQALADALGALAAACAEDEALASAAAREAALLRVAAGPANATDVEETSAWRRRRVAAARARGHGGAQAAVGGPARRARGGGRGADRDGVPRRAGLRGVVRRHGSALEGRPRWRARRRGRGSPGCRRRRRGRAAGLGDGARAGAGAAISDLPLAAGGAWPDGRPDTRRARARRNGGPFGTALDLEVALDAERRGALGSALAIYGSIIATDPERLEAWFGIRRVARAGRRHDRRGARAGAPGRRGPRSRRGGGAARARRPSSTSGRAGSTTPSPRSRNAWSCGPTIRPPTCGRTSCCAPIWRRRGGASCSTRCCRTGWPRRR